MSKPALSDFNPKYQAQISAQLHATPRPRTVQIAVADAPKKRLRQNSGGLNKTEAAFQKYMDDHCKVCRTGDVQIELLKPQSVTLLIANGCRYTPDFITTEIEEGAAKLCAYEVKGFMRDDAAVKIKVAASVYPWITFYLVSKAKGGTWDVQEVLA